MDGAVTKETKKMDGAVTKETKKKRVRVWTDEEKQKNRESKRKRYFLTRMHKGRASALLKSFREFEESGNHILALDFLERAAFSKNCALAAISSSYHDRIGDCVGIFLSKAGRGDGP